MARPTPIVLVQCFALAVFFVPATASEYCVVCTGPDATYRCAFEGNVTPSRGDPRYQFLCVAELAKAGGHQSCSVSRNTGGPCDGPVRSVALPDDAPLIAAPPPEAAVPAEPPAAPPTDAAEVNENKEQIAEKQPPATVEDMAKQSGLNKAGEVVKDSAKSAGESLGKAGSAVGNAAKKTWNCLTSLFKEC